MVQADTAHIYDYLQVIIRRRWVVLTFFTVLVMTVFIGTISQTRIYEAKTTLRIERSSPKIVQVEQVSQMGDMGDSRVYKDYYETQYKLISSPTTLKKVADALGMGQGARGGQDAVKSLQKAVKVMPIKSSQLVEIIAENPDPKMAAKIANTVADEYIRRNLETSINTSADAAEWLTKKIEEQKYKLEEAELALQKYREVHNISTLPESSKQDIAAEDVKKEYVRSQAQLANFSERYTEEHPKMVELKAEISSLRNKIQGLEDVSVSNETSEFRALDRNVQTNKRMYEALLNRLKEIDVSSTLNTNNISIIDRAQVPDKASKPSLVLNMILAVMVGLVMGVGLGFFIEYLDATIKSPYDVKNTLKAYFLGSIPEITGSIDSEKDRFMHLNPVSPIAEAYRHIRTEILSRLPKDKAARSILITSAEPQAGKTTTIVNLAIALTQSGHKVLLVDADLRKGQMHKVFNVNKDGGLSDYLMDEAKIDSIVKDTGIDNFKIITIGKRTERPAELLGSDGIKKFIQQAKERFDFVLFDTPPIISVADPVILADMVDAAIQVVRSGKILAPAAIRAKEKLETTKTQNLGVILNDMRIDSGAYYDYYHYKYYNYYGDDGERTKKHRKVTFTDRVKDALWAMKRGS